jgi:hypothetical protein
MSTTNTSASTNTGGGNNVSTSTEDCVDAQVRKDVVVFLRDLADKLESNSLSPEATAQISEFFMKFNFVKALFSDMEDTPESTDESPEQDVLKFMSLGWYVYNHLLPRVKGNGGNGSGEEEDESSGSDEDREDQEVDGDREEHKEASS